jgi:hypothetical protein
MEYQGTNNPNDINSAAVTITTNPASDSKNRKPATAQQLIRENVKFLINLADTANDASERLRRHFDSCSACKG